MNKSQRFWATAALVSCAIMGLTLLFYSRKPLCLNSQLVERIDRVGTQTKSEIYKCEYNRSIPYSIFWRDHLLKLNLRLQRLESSLNLFSSTNRGLQIVLFQNKEDVQLLQGRTIYLSENLLSQDGLLESLLIRGWLKEMNPAFLDQNPLLVEALTENFLYSAYGDNSFANLRSERYKKPQREWYSRISAANDVSCSKVRRLTDKFNLCLDGARPKWFETEKFAVQSWMGVFKSLPWNEKIPFMKELIKVIKRSSVSPEMLPSEAESTGTLSEVDGSQSLKDLKTLVHVLVQSDLGHDDVVFQKFLVRLSTVFQDEGLQEMVEDSSMSLVYFVEDQIGTDSPLYISMMELSRRFPGEKIAILDEKKVWFFPVGLSLPRKSLKWVKSKQMIFQTCRALNLAQIQQFSIVSDRFLLVRNCENQNPLQLAQFLKNGAEGFAIQNPGTPFVHFHLPSLLLKKNLLNDKKDIFELLTAKNSANQDDSLSDALGWQQLEWKKDLQAYSPRAVVDAINLFRTPTRL